MNWDSLRDKLVRAARQHPPGDHVPYAFEGRVMAILLPAGLRGDRSGIKDDWSAIARALWWAASACSAIALAVGVWTYAPEGSESFAEDLEQTILASVDDAGLDLDFDFLR